MVMIIDKIKNIVKAQGNIKVSDKVNDYDFNAQKLSYFKEREKIKNKRERKK